MSRFARLIRLREAVRRPNSAPRHVRTWVDRCLEPESEHYRGYRAFGWDLDRDLADLSARFDPRSGEFMQLESEYFLRRIWRFLLRNHAVAEARCVERRLNNISKDHWLWRAWRRLSYYYPRLVVGIAVGYLAMLGAGDFVDFLQHAARRAGGGYALLLAIFLLSAFSLGMAEVQHRVGRRLCAVLLRSLRLWLYGVVYDIFGLVFHLLIRSWLGHPFCWTYPLLLASAALFVAFVIQLFWLDLSLGEPI